MASTIFWSVENLQRDLSDGLVTQVHWCCSISDGEINAVNYGTLSLERGETFTPYEDLTQDQVLGWVKSNVDVESIEAGLQAVIDEKKNPIAASGVPWQERQAASL